MQTIAVVTSLHPDFDSRVWKYCTCVAKRARTVHLLCPWSVPDGSVIEGVHIHTFAPASRRLSRPVLTPMRLLPKLMPLLPKVDLVHFHDIDILPWMAAVSLVKPVVYDVHENYAEEMLVREWVPRLLRIPLFHGVRCAQYVFASVLRNVILTVPSQERQFQGRRFHKHAVRNYASVELLAKTAGDDYLDRQDRVVFTGSNYESNGSLLLLEIARRLKSRLPGLRFLMADRFADAGFRKTFLDIRSSWGLEDYVEMAPNVLPRKLPTLLNRSTIALAPNLRVPKQEMAIPTKLFEYMAAALPIVSSDLPYAKELLTRHEIGCLAQPEDPETFARAVEKLVADRAIARRLGVSGQEAFKTAYSWESQMDDLFRYYEEILPPRKAA